VQADFGFCQVKGGFSPGTTSERELTGGGSANESGSAKDKGLDPNLLSRRPKGVSRDPSSGHPVPAWVQLRCKHME
jgi:hypothetical protein